LNLVSAEAHKFSVDSISLSEEIDLVLDFDDDEVNSRSSSSGSDNSRIRISHYKLPEAKNRSKSDEKTCKEVKSKSIVNESVVIPSNDTLARPKNGNNLKPVLSSRGSDEGSKHRKKVSFSLPDKKGQLIDRQ
jgi:hypothetical protein